MTADGEILIGAGNDRLFGILCRLLGRPEWIIDERFVDNSARVANRDVLESMIEAETRRRTTQVCLSSRGSENHLLAPRVFDPELR